ncbi:ester cyclase [Pseudalkalibacillus sp. A8]|uniref:ester cyclase n=1 Tax=Pseudalkalibacillus sp. A8 TaxID=3382641 RepID=UPI0038B58316
MSYPENTFTKRTWKTKDVNEKVFYGDIDVVNRLGYQDYNEFIKNTERKQSMNGFDKTYLDFVDYILKITHRIWEEKGVGLIYDTYHNDIKVHFNTCTMKGINKVVSKTLQSLHAFPDEKVVGENVIWSGDDEDGFYSSHRLSSTSTNLGNSSYGPATGKKVAYRGTADCFCYGNRIVEEWIVGDTLHIVQQLGLNPVEIAKKLARNATNSPALQTSFGAGDTMEGQLVPNVYTREYSQFEIGDFILEVYNKLWERRFFDYVRKFYTDNSTVNFVGGKRLVGTQQIQGMFISLFASFPTARFVIERVTCNQGGTPKDWDAAVRWRLQGIHEGIGYFGQPSGKPIELLGINHVRVRHGKIIEEWITFDGMDLLKQIYLNCDSKLI